MMEWNKLLEGELLPPHDIVTQMREVEQYWLGQAHESFDEGAFTLDPMTFEQMSTSVQMQLDALSSEHAHDETPFEEWLRCYEVLAQLKLAIEQAETNRWLARISRSLEALAADKQP